MPACAKADTNAVDVAFNSFVSEHFTSIDQQLCLLIDLDAMMSKLFHDTSDLWTARLVAVFANT